MVERKRGWEAVVCEAVSVEYRELSIQDDESRAFSHGQAARDGGAAAVAVKRGGQ